MAGTAEVSSVYKKRNEKGRIEYSKKYIVEVPISGSVKAINKEEALEIFINDITGQYEVEDSVVISNCNNIKANSVSTSNINAGSRSTMLMRSSSNILDYNHIKEYKDFLNTKDECGFDNLLAIYSPLIKGFTKDALIEICQESYEKDTQTKPIIKDDSDDDDNFVFGIRNNNGVQTVYNYYSEIKSNNDFWKPEYGISPLMILEICKNWDISHYAFDTNKKVFLKYVSKNRSYPALFYFSINNHMYLVKDEAYCKSLTEIAKSTPLIYNTSMLEKESKKNIFSGEILENIPLEDLRKYTDPVNNQVVIIYSREIRRDISDLKEQIIRMYNIIPSKISATRTSTDRFSIKLDKTEYILVADPNDLKTGVNWKLIKSLCDKENIEFVNQTLVRYLKQIKEKLYDTTKSNFTTEFKTELLTDNDNVCSQCNIEIDLNHCEINHIKSLASGGSNESNNLQPLCKSCHKEKTTTELSDGSYVKIDETESSYSNELLNIVNSPLGQSLAFIEKMKERRSDKNSKTFCFDINKTR